jgi:hypothetical protein
VRTKDRRSIETGLTSTNPKRKEDKMEAKLFRVISQSEVVMIDCDREPSGKLAKSTLRMRVLGGPHGDEFVASLYFNLAHLKFREGDVVAAVLRFRPYHYNGNLYQDCVANDVVKLV